MLPPSKRNSLMSLFPSQHLCPLLSVPGKAARSRGMGRKVSTLIPQICPLSPYSHFQLLPVAAGGPLPGVLLPSFLCLSHCCRWQVSATVWSNSSWWELVSLQYHRSSL